jgi:tRNA(fMet)-specific endonuclease VapC
MIILDTSFIVDILRGRPDALTKLSVIEDSGEIICTTCINVLELYKGAYRSTRIASNLEAVRKIVEALLVIPISDETYDIFGAISSRLSSEGEPLGDFDELIASIALAHNASIVTKDEHFHRIGMLNIMNY